MKKFINDVANVETEMLDGMAATYPQYVKRMDGLDVIVRADKKADKVALVSGGGSGHEPTHAGYVGKGMLDAACAGAVYTSPTPDQIFEAIKEVDAGKGVLLVIKNYTGDVMNFEMAADMARDEGIDVADLKEVQRVAQKVIDNVRSMGVAIKPSTVPAAGTPGFELAEDEMEMGVGIHGEPGVATEKIKPADGIVDELLEHIFKDKDYAGKEVALMVNGSGATPEMELLILSNHAHKVLADKGIKIYKTLLGNFMTSIDQAGASLSLLELDDELKALLDAPADTPAMTVV